MCFVIVFTGLKKYVFYVFYVWCCFVVILMMMMMMIIIKFLKGVWPNHEQNGVEPIVINCAVEAAQWFVCLSIYLATFKCSRGMVNCGGSSPSRTCIEERNICDGTDDCGNGWDEDPTPRTCGQFAHWILVSGLVLTARQYSLLCWYPDKSP